ncbi:hypothetical protein B0H13DRAFT_1865989 [Mycena leptocephala]|nr:hypothetical protein B0H13DRAFT_1865989 [Mycena leptocephala]
MAGGGRGSESGAEAAGGGGNLQEVVTCSVTFVTKAWHSLHLFFFRLSSPVIIPPFILATLLCLSLPSLGTLTTSLGALSTSSGPRALSASSGPPRALSTSRPSFLASFSRLFTVFQSSHNPTALPPPNATSTHPPPDPESSFDTSYLSHDDLSACSPDFFEGVPGLGPLAALQMSSQPMPAWAHMEPVEEPVEIEMEIDQAEIDADRFADEDEEEEEEDELPDESPIPRHPWRGRKRSLSPQAPLTPICYPHPPEEEQHGGGYPRREATPPKNPPPTRLCRTIAVSARATGNEAAEAMRTHRKDSVMRTQDRFVEESGGGWTGFMNPFVPPPPPSGTGFTNPFGLPPPPSGPPSTAIPLLKKAAGKRKSCEEPANKSGAGFTNPFGLPLPPSGPPSAAFVTPSTAIPLSEKAAGKRKMREEPANESGAEWTGFMLPPPPPRPPSVAVVAPSAPSGQISAAFVAPSAPSADSAGFAPPSETPSIPPEAPPTRVRPAQPKLLSRRAMSDEPGAEPVAQACAEGTPESTRRHPSVDSNLPVLRLKLGHSPVPHFTALGQPPHPHSAIYQPMPLPPPPAGYNSAVDRMNLPPVAEVSEQDGNDGEDDAVVKDVGVHTLSMAFGQETGLEPEHFITALTHSIPKKGSRSGNGWNMYQSFARSNRHAVEEYQHIAPDFDPITMELPVLTAVDLRDMYKKFQEDFPEGEAESILEAYSELAHLNHDETMASRQRQFERVCKSIRASINAANEKNSEVIVFICGVHVNEDTELGSVIATPALETAFTASLKNSTTGLPLTNNDLLAVAKICAYLGQMEQYLGSGVTVPDAAVAALEKLGSAERAAKAFTKGALCEGLLRYTPAVPTRPSTIAAAAPTIAGPSTVELVRINNSTQALNEMRDRFCDMSQTCLGFDLFRDKGTALASNNLRLVGYPTNVRLPGELYTDKGSGAWRNQDLTWLNVALLEHETGSSWGLRLERHQYAVGDLVIVGHDYAIAAPHNPSDAIVHWQTSRGARVPCQNAQGDVWSACIDLRRAGDPAIVKSLIQARQITKGKKKKSKVKVEDGEEDDEEDDNGNDNDNDDKEEEEEEESRPKAKTKKKVVEVKKVVKKVAEAKKVAEGRKPALGKTTTKRKTSHASYENTSDNNGPEEEDTTSPPPPKKLRSAGPPTPIPPPVRASQRTAMQEGGGNARPVPKAKVKPAPAKPSAKPVSFAPPGAPIPLANDPDAVAERLKRVRAMPTNRRSEEVVQDGNWHAEQDGGASTSHGTGAKKRKAANASTAWDFVVPKTFAASAGSSAVASAHAGPSSHSSASSYAPSAQLPVVLPSSLAHPPAVLPPAVQALPALPENLAQVTGQLAHIPTSDLAALLTFLQRPPQLTNRSACYDDTPEGDEGQREETKMEIPKTFVSGTPLSALGRAAEAREFE